MSANNDAADEYDKGRWREVPIEGTVGGLVSHNYTSGQRHFTCPMVLKYITPTSGELDKCIKCPVARSGHCGGYNGAAPTPRKGARITLE